MASFVDPSRPSPANSIEFYSGRRRRDQQYPEFAYRSDDTQQPEQVRNSREVSFEEDQLRIYGTWDGVFIRCLTDIFGAILFLRVGWMVGEIGIIQSLLIVFLSGAVAMITTFSMSAICTNGRVKAGGAYYMISRVMGYRQGGAIGVLFALSNCLAVSLYILGFVETLTEVLGTSLTGDDTRLFGIILTIACTVVVRLGLLWKAQFLSLMIISLVMVYVLIGTTFAHNPDKGITGYSSTTAGENFWASYSSTNVLRVFGVYFPAATGIMSGANRSGELKKPEKSIPLGTIWAVSVATIVYAILVVCLGCVAVRDTGNSKGLKYNYLIMADIVPWGPFVIIGIFAATLSSALGALVGGHRIMTAVISDDIIPGSSYLKDRPNAVYLVVFLIAASGVCIGGLDEAAKLITMFYLLLYALLNFSVSQLEVSKSPWWRPSFLFYSWWSGLLGALACTVIMFLIDWLYALVAFVAAIMVYKLFSNLRPNMTKGSAQIALKQLHAIKSLLALRKYPNDRYRPHFLLLWDGICYGCAEFEFLGCLSAGGSAVFVGSILSGPDQKKKGNDFLRKGFTYDPDSSMSDSSASIGSSILNHFQKKRNNVGNPHRKNLNLFQPPGKDRRESLESKSSNERRVSISQNSHTSLPNFILNNTASFRNRNSISNAPGGGPGADVPILPLTRKPSESDIRGRRESIGSAQSLPVKLKTPKPFPSLRLSTLFEPPPQLTASQRQKSPPTLKQKRIPDPSQSVPTTPKTMVMPPRRRNKQNPQKREKKEEKSIRVEPAVGGRQARSGKRHGLLSAMGWFSRLWNSTKPKTSMKSALKVVTRDKQLDEKNLQIDIYKPKPFTGFLEHEGLLNKTRGFEDRIVAPTFTDGARSLIQTCGIGNLRPNVVVSQFPPTWAKMTVGKRIGYIRTIQHSLGAGKGVVITANFPRLWIPPEHNNTETDAKLPKPPSERFIDVWWLTDEGGLTLLIPYLLSLHASWKHCTVRLFTVTNEERKLTDEERALTKLLTSLRIPWEDNLHILPITGDLPSEALHKWPSYKKTHDKKIRDDIRRWIRISQLVKKHSSDSEIVFVTLPIPKRFKALSRPSVFSTKLEAIAEPGMPVVFVRGSGENVLTFSLDR